MRNWVSPPLILKGRLSPLRDSKRAFACGRSGHLLERDQYSRQLRGQLIDLFADYKARVRIVYLEAPLAETACHNLARACPVPEAHIARMPARWEPPDLTECHTLWAVLT